MKYYFLGQIKCPGSEQVGMGPFVIPLTGGPDLTRGRTFTITLVPTTFDFNFVNKLDRP